MSQETTDNFWQAFNAWQPDPPKPVFYRLYYNDNGNPITYTMEDLPGNYIDVDRITYLTSSMNVKVINGQMIKIETRKFDKLVPAVTGISCSTHDVCVIVNPTQPNTKWSLNTNETN